MPTNFIIAAPNFQGRNENYISRHLYENLEGRNVWIEGETSVAAPMPVTSGAFFDDSLWMEYQANVINKVAGLSFSDGDNLVFCDFWFPGLDILAYKRDMSGKDVKFFGYLHGASFVDGDLMQGTLPWVPHSESAWLKIYDEIWCASAFFAKNIIKEYGDKIVITGEPFNPAPYIQYRGTKRTSDYQVIFPHRLDADKTKDLLPIAEGLINSGIIFAIACMELKDGPLVQKLLDLGVKFLVGRSNTDHIQDLAKAKVVLSCATQEGWGYAIMKAISVGCTPVLPDRAVYPQLYQKKYLYSSVEECIEKVLHFCNIHPKESFIPKTYKISGKLEGGHFICNTQQET
jgi:hypothetical protein